MFDLVTTPAVAYLCLVRFMHAVPIYRALLLLRVGWLLVEWFFGWDARRHVSFTLLHPYASFFAHAPAEFTLVVIIAGLWFVRPWARLYICFGPRSQSLTALFGRIAVYYCRRHLLSRSVGVLSL